MTEQQWTALKAWIESEAKAYAWGLLSRGGRLTEEEMDAREAFGLPRKP